MLFSCQVFLIEPDPGNKILSAYSFVEFQILPTEGKRLIFQPKNSKLFFTMVRDVIPILDLEFGAAIRYVISLKILSTEKKIENGKPKKK